MKTTVKLFVAALLLASAGSAWAAVHYVDANNLNSSPPFTNWLSAATNVQDAVDAAVAGDEIVVTNGTYRSVVVNKPLSVRTVSGPQLTIIDGGHSNRCVYLTNGASLFGFTLTNGLVLFLGSRSYGGGLFCESSNAVVSNCVVSGNSAVGVCFCGGGIYGPAGGGVYGGTLNNCILGNNQAQGHYNSGSYGSGGGAANATLNNCTLSGNSAALSGGGASGCTLNNCTLSGNSARDGGGGAFGSTLNNCTLSDNSAFGGVDLEGEYYPGFGGGAWTSTLNNCIVYFNTAPNHYSCTLNYSCTTPLPTNGVGNIANEPAFVNFAAGNYRLRADSPCLDAGTNLSASITNDLDGRPRPLDGNGDGLAAFDMGAYEYRRPLLVWQDSPNPSSPHVDWATAAHTIQDAVDDAFAGDEILVTNGIYATGGLQINGTTTRVVIAKSLTVRSVNGAGFTAIEGAMEFPGIRCVYLTNNATLSGFMLTNGGAGAGGGVFCESRTAVVSNCVVTGNSAVVGLVPEDADGGGAFGGSLNNCTLTDNSADFGGGAYSCILKNCTLIGNSAWFSGGGGGAAGCILHNCIVYSNAGPLAANYDPSCTLNYSCTTPLPTSGVGNISNAPLFVDLAGGNLRLQSNSPCINAGLNVFAPAGPDLDGNPRIAGGTVDIGAYEFQSPASRISYAWLQRYALPTDGSVDTTDPDGDRLNNWQEWRCGTEPTNAGSTLRLLVPAVVGSDLVVRWESVADRTYFLERSSAAASGFTPLATNIPGLTGTTTFADTNATKSGPFFYRVGIQ